MPSLSLNIGLNNGRRLPFGGFNPISISGLQLWLDATKGLFDATSGGNPVTADGSSVARWEDQSGNSRNALQATSINRPILKTSVRNGKNGIRFDGINDCMATGSFAHSVPLTLFIACKRLSNTGSQSDFNRIVEHGANTGLCIVTRTSGLIAYQYSTSEPRDSLFDPGTNTQVYEMFVDSSAPRNITFRINNANETTTSRAGTPSTPATFNLSQFITNNSFNSNIEIYELCYYNVKISDSDRDNVRNYLNSKWGVY
jgi:hypothetical protein